MDSPANVLFPTDPEGTSTALRPGMRWNLLWYAPLFAFVVWYFGVANAKAAYDNISLVFRHWTWMLLLTPSAYLFFSTAVYSVFLPIHFMLFIPVFFSPDAKGPTYARRYLFSFLVLLALIVALVVTQLVIRDSFPLCWPADGIERLRLVPFLPCPA
jgi:hypothetical protein